MAQQAPQSHDIHAVLRYSDGVQSPFVVPPNGRTLIVVGFPNVGKSSLVNSMTRANVEVQPYAFTTKSLSVGPTDYKYLRFHVLDTPGLLNHPLENRNMIEMLTIDAIAHLRAVILFVIDVSGDYYTIKEQVSLLGRISPLFASKPSRCFLVGTKADLMRHDLSPEDRALIETAAKDAQCEAELFLVDSLTGSGVDTIKAAACDRLLELRVQTKIQQLHSPQVPNSSLLEDVMDIETAAPDPSSHSLAETKHPDPDQRPTDPDQPVSGAAAAGTALAGPALEAAVSPAGPSNQPENLVDPLSQRQ